eukprot:6959981-Alexandrium_andersonii.AAC.1
MTRPIGRASGLPPSCAPPATIDQPVGLRVRSPSGDPMWSTRLIADVDGPAAVLAQRPGAHVFIE